MWRENLVLLLTMLFLFHRQQINSDIMFFTIQFLFHSSPISFLFSLLFFFSPSRFSPIYKSSPHFSFLYVLLSPSQYSEQYSKQYSEPTGRKQSTVSSLILSEMKIETLKKALWRPHIWMTYRFGGKVPKLARVPIPLHNRNIFYSFEAVGCYYQRQWLLAFETFLLNGFRWNSSYAASSHIRAGFLLWGDFCEATLFW